MSGRSLYSASATPSTASVSITPLNAAEGNTVAPTKREIRGADTEKARRICACVATTRPRCASARSTAFTSGCCHSTNRAVGTLIVDAMSTSTPPGSDHTGTDRNGYWYQFITGNHTPFEGIRKHYWYLMMDNPFFHNFSSCTDRTPRGGEELPK